MLKDQEIRRISVSEREGHKLAITAIITKKSGGENYE